MGFDKTGNTLLWYKGLGEVGLVDVKTLKEQKTVSNAVRKIIQNLKINRWNCCEKTLCFQRFF